MEMRAFTIKSQHTLREIITDCEIFPAFDPDALSRLHQVQPKGRIFKAIWDTGATNSVISGNVVRELHLTNCGFTQINHAGGHETVPVFMVNIGLPTHVGFPLIRVSLGNITGADVLIGMDIISQGDLAITNVGGKTTVSFRTPSIKELDFVHNDKLNKLDPYVAPAKPRPNDPCPCGSGKKYKNCCGRNK